MQLVTQYSLFLENKPGLLAQVARQLARAKINVVSDGNTLLLDADQAGDEPRLLAETLPGVPVLTGIVRRFPAQHAIEMGALAEIGSDIASTHEMEPVLERIFKEFAGPQGLENRRRRSIAKVVITG